MAGADRVHDPVQLDDGDLGPSGNGQAQKHAGEPHDAPATAPAIDWGGHAKV